MSSPDQMEEFDPNHTPPSPGLDDPSSGLDDRSSGVDDRSSGQSSISTPGDNDEETDHDEDSDNDEESQYPIIETSPANPAPTDFPNMTLSEVHDKYLAPGTKFADRDTLRKLVSLIAKNYHFATSYACSLKIECAQGKCHKSPASKPKNSIKIGCPYVVNFKALEKKKSADGSRRVPDPSKEIEITTTISEHICNPTPAMRVKLLQKSGKFFEYLPNSALFLLANHLEAMPKLNHRVLRTLMQQIFPRSISWDRWKLTNVRRYVLNRIKTFEGSPNVFRNYKLFQAQFPSKTLLNTYDIKSDEQSNSEAAAFIWKEMVADNSEDILLHLEKMKHSIEGFDFRALNDPSDNSIIAFVWMTDIMRGNIYRYVENMSLDMRHAETNDLLWPYMSVVFRDEKCKIAIGCEGFCIAETVEAYQFLLNAMFHMAGFASRSDVLVVNADGFLNQDIVLNKFDLPNAHFIQDSWHLKNSYFRKNYPKCYERNKTCFERLLMATSEQQYSSSAKEIEESLASNYAELAKFRAFLSEKEHHAAYIVTKKKGSLGRRSSVPSEQNHSSIQRWQGDGYYADIITCMHDHYLRHIHRISSGRESIQTDNVVLKGYSLKLDDSQVAQKEASKVFNLQGYDMFVNELSDSVNYFLTRVAREGQGDSVGIQRCDSDAPPVIIDEAKGGCTECSICVSKLFFFCKHTIVYLAHTQGCTVNRIKLDKTKIANRYSYVADIVRIKSLGGELLLFLKLFFMKLPNILYHF